MEDENGIKSSESDHHSLSCPPSVNEDCAPMISTPVQSNLPELYSTLRKNDHEVIHPTNTNNSSMKRTSNKSIEDELQECTLKEPLGNSSTAKPNSIFLRNSGSQPRSRSNSLSKSGIFKRLSRSPAIEAIEADEGLELNSHLAETVGQIKIPDVFLKEGLPLMKVSLNSRKRINFKIDASTFKFSWKSALKSTSATSNSTINRILPLNTSKIHEFSLDDLKTVSFGSDASNYREELCLSKEIESKWISIIYFNPKQQKLKQLHLIADTTYDFSRFKSTIKSLKKLRESLARNFFIDVGDINESNRNFIIGNSKQTKQFISFNDILKYSSRLNINLNQKYLQSIFNRVASAPQQGLTFEEFRKFVTILKERKDIAVIFEKLTEGTNCMSFEAFRKFALEEQCENFSEERLQKIFRKFNRGSILEYWTSDIFNDYLLSKYATPLVTIHDGLEYFNYPLNEYYISSSHNTYLRGRQFAGDSSVEGYIKVLLKGCKCVEVDVWDPPNSLFKEPIVNHGRTFTNPISFSNVMKTIKKYAFITSPFPVIVSLEVHCSLPNQKRIIELAKEILGESLLTQPLEEESTILPSPLQLKYKILLKVKKTSKFANLMATEDGTLITANSSTSTTSTQSEDGESGKKLFLRRRTLRTKIDDSLSNLGVYFQGLKFRNFSLPESKTFNHCFSLSEKAINSMLKDETKRYSVDKHNRKYFMRIYPSNMRMLSSNFIPLNYWAHGIQMVATNWQTYDLGQQLNEAMFDGIKKQGFLLKPLELRKPLLRTSKLLKVLQPKVSISFSITIISAQHLPMPRESVLATNPMVSFEIYGAELIQWDKPDMASCKTSIVAENGFNPIWNSTFSGKIQGNSNLIFLRFFINASSSSMEESEVLPIGIFVCKLSYLKNGYRYLPIYDMLGQELIYSSLFVNIKYSIT